MKPKNPRKLPCMCGHGRSVHKYIYYGKLLSVRSPCKKCGTRKTSVPVTSYPIMKIEGTVVVSEPNCNYYRVMNNLDYIEWLAKKRKLV